MRRTEFVDLREDIDLCRHFFRNRFDNQVGVTSSFLYSGGELNAPEGQVGVCGGNFAQIDSFVQVGANLAFCFAEGGWKNVFEDGAETAERSSMGDTPSHDAGAHYGDSFNPW